MACQRSKQNAGRLIIASDVIEERYEQSEKDDESQKKIILVSRSDLPTNGMDLDLCRLSCPRRVTNPSNDCHERSVEKEIWQVFPWSDELKTRHRRLL